MNKRGSHVGIIASFTIFIMFLIGIYLVLDPVLRTQKDKQLLLDHLEIDLLNEFSDNLTTAIISSEGGTCLNLNDSEVGISDEYAIVKDKNKVFISSVRSGNTLVISSSSETSMWVYYSPVEFYGNYQEDANTKICNNEFCDGDWSSYNNITLGNPEYSFNYSVPSNAIGVLWRIKENLLGERNLTISGDCWNYAINNNLLVLKVINTGVGSTWRCLATDGEDVWWDYPFMGQLGINLYEEGIWWQVETPSGCSVPTIESVRNSEEIFEKKIRDGINDFENLKANLSIPVESEISLSFEMANGKILSAGKKNVSTNVYAREIPIQYIDYYANNVAGKLIIRIW